MISYNYPTYFTCSENILETNGCSENRSQYWVDPHSIIVKNGGNESKSAGNGSASLRKQNSIKNGFRVVEVVGGPVYTHSLEHEFSYLYLMIKGIFH